MDWAPFVCSKGTIDSNAVITVKVEGYTHQLTAEVSTSWVKHHALKDLCFQKILSWKRKLFPLRFFVNGNFGFLPLRSVTLTPNCSLDYFESPSVWRYLVENMTGRCPYQSIQLLVPEDACPSMPHKFPKRLLFSVFEKNRV